MFTIELSKTSSKNIYFKSYFFLNCRTQTILLMAKQNLQNPRDGFLHLKQNFEF